jgi:hypothetical protein
LQLNAILPCRQINQKLLPLMHGGKRCSEPGSFCSKASPAAQACLLENLKQRSVRAGTTALAPPVDRRSLSAAVDWAAAPAVDQHGKG